MVNFFQTSVETSTGDLVYLLRLYRKEEQYGFLLSVSKGNPLQFWVPDHYPLAVPTPMFLDRDCVGSR
jgi:hypothetical protein